MVTAMYIISKSLSTLCLDFLENVIRFSRLEVPESAELKGSINSTQNYIENATFLSGKL